MRARYSVDSCAARSVCCTAVCPFDVLADVAAQASMYFQRPAQLQAVFAQLEERNLQLLQERQVSRAGRG